MTCEEKQLIKMCRMMIVGDGELIGFITDELSKAGFGVIKTVETIDEIHADNNVGIVIEHIGSARCQSGDVTDVPIIFPFDFVAGAGVVVLFPGDDRSWLDNQNLRVWAAEYMAGYCAFWNLTGCDWLYDALPSIKGGETSAAALRTAAYMCAKVAANIAVGRDVKHYPRFYLAESGGWNVFYLQ